MLKLHDNEKLITIFRKHIFHFLIQIFGLVFLAFLPFVAYLFFASFIPLDPSPRFTYFFLFIYFVFLAVLWNSAFILWTDYYLDMWILTDKRLIDIEQKGLFSRDISSLRLDNIQDIKLEVFGIINTLIGMGSVHVQTAGIEKEFIIRNAKNPERVKEIILFAHNKQMEEIKTVRVENK